MNKTIKTVFLIIGLLVLIFLIWQLVFNKGGIVRTVYNTMVNGINKQWEKLAGSGEKLLPTWNAAEADTGGDGFAINGEK